jgi:uncharacterized membrane protein YfcA
MFITGCLFIFLVGCFLGALGAGGAIFSIPILIYFFKLPTNDAISISYLLTGITALLAVVKYFKDLEWHRYSYFFIIPAIIMTWFMRTELLPFLEKFTSIEQIQNNLMFYLSLFMFLSAYAMLFYIPRNRNPQHHHYLMVLLALGYGTLVGGVGSGGGFLLIPIFRMLMGMHMKQAVANSLSIIALTSLIGFEASQEIPHQFSWSLITHLSLYSIAGMLLGLKLHDTCPQPLLQKIFSCALIITATGILLGQLNIWEWHRLQL